MSRQERPHPSELADRPVDFEFMSPDEWLEFHCELYDVIAHLGLAVRSVDAGVVRLRDGRTIGLLQLAQHCHVRPRDGWSELIGSHLTTMTAHLMQEDRAPFSVFDLRVRLVPDDPADAEVFARFGARPFAEGVVQVLAVDVPDAVRCVPVDEIEALGWDVDEAWRSAALQTEMLERPQQLHRIVVAETEVFHVFGARPFTASMVGVVDRLIGGVAPVGEYGAIVSIPTRHSIVVHPVRDDTARRALVAMVPITRRLHARGPGSVSPHLYWWQNGGLTWIPTYYESTSKGCSSESYLPSELMAAIESLSPDEA
ncbi:hypothetical protein [Ilumatobacter sp.]|uniref:hypothetical protein n=1 Tax=Ilumatobacter sp. TaxID=1967498 RepID=UPI003B52025D